MLCMKRSDIKRLKNLYRSWLKEAFEYEKKKGGEIISCYSLRSEIRRVKGDDSYSCIREYLKGYNLLIPSVTGYIVGASLRVISAPILVFSRKGPLHIDDTHRGILFCHQFGKSDWNEFADLYWNIITECVLNGF